MADLEYMVIGEMRKVRGLRPVEPDNFSINKLDTLVGTFNSVLSMFALSLEARKTQLEGQN